MATASSHHDIPLTTTRTAEETPAATSTETLTVGARRALAALRIGIGWIFMWTFLDKAFGLGFSTGRNPETGSIDYFSDAAWINGASPTEGFLSFGLHTKEPFTTFYGNLAGQGWVDWVYMLSMLGIGLALILGVAMRPAAIAGITWMAMFYSASAIWPEHNPVVDDHVIYAIALGALALIGAGRTWGLGARWRALGFVQGRSWLH